MKKYKYYINKKGKINMLKTRSEKIEAMFDLLYNEIKTENNEMMKLEKSNNNIKVDKSNLIELIKDMEKSLRISVECIEKGEIIADIVSEGYFSTARKNKKREEKEKDIKEAKQRKKDNEKL